MLLFITEEGGTCCDFMSVNVNAVMLEQAGCGPEKQKIKVKC